MKKLISLFLVITLSFTLFACGNSEESYDDYAGKKTEEKDDDNGEAIEETEPEATEPDAKEEVPYEVTVLDAEGKPASNVVVKFMQGDKQIAMQPVDANGVATTTLPKGDYIIELACTDDKMIGYFDPTTAVLSAETPAIQINLMNAVSGEGVDVEAGGETVKAYNVGAGKTYVTVNKGVRNYFLFTTTQAGSYEVTTDNKDLKVGYYGALLFIQDNSIAEVKDNTFTLAVYNSNIGQGEGGTTVYVIGIDGITEDASCILSITRTGEPPYNISEEPWTEYKTTHTPTKFTLELAEGQGLTYVDIMGTTEANQVIYNEADGYYHFGAANGPVVYMHLGKDAPYVSLQTVIQGDGSTGGAPIRHYFFDADGNFIKREDYTDILTSYFDNMDEKVKVYPLTQDLIYIIQNGCANWWTVDSPDKMAAFDGCNTEIAWMFALCYLA